ncbi:MAG: tail fiber domain-containing protein [Deltaproteobacteria bacterium]|nr:tail fiber domain-containing protein [Deltaproteobacteria bacterium]
MSIISDLFGGGDAADASKEAAGVQSAATQEATAFQREALATTRADLQPFRAAGEAGLPGLSKSVSSLSDLANDPNKQVSLVKDNPFFKLLADDAQSRLFANQAAKGKVGSGETAKALQNSLLLLGQDLLNQDVNRKNTAINQQFNLATLGANAAARQGTATANTASNISNLATEGANATAAGIVGAANAKTAATNSAINTGMSAAALFLSDKRLKTDIRKLGKDDIGLNVYAFKYKGDDKRRVGHMAQDVEKKFPDAVKTIRDIKFIDYGELHAN